MGRELKPQKVGELRGSNATSLVAHILLDRNTPDETWDALQRLAKVLRAADKELQRIFSLGAAELVRTLTSGNGVAMLGTSIPREPEAEPVKHRRFKK